MRLRSCRRSRIEIFRERSPSRCLKGTKCLVDSLLAQEVTVNAAPVRPPRFHREFVLLDKCLGTGSFGKVLKASSKKDGQLRAVKIIKQMAKGVDPRNEVATMRAVNHPNVMPLEGAFEDLNQWYLVMPLMESTLHNWIYRQTEMPNLEDIRRWVIQLASGLEACHRAQILHRDVKPQNAMIKGETLRLGDFGLAMKLLPEKTERIRAGTKGYMAPEVYTRQPYGFSADMWCLGITLAEMITKMHPRGYSSVPGLINQIPYVEDVFEFIIFPSSFLTLKVLIKKLLQLEPSLRPTSSQVMQVLQRGETWCTQDI